MTERKAPRFLPALTDKDAEHILSDIRNFIQGTVEEAGFGRVVLGLSGGVDSALVCALAVQALGHSSVLGIKMPYSTSSKESLTDAALVADTFSIDTEIQNISPMVDGYCYQLGMATTPVRKGNLMARMRMATLFDFSAYFNALVIGTGNRTEGLLGYGTLFGDMACSLNPIGNLYKTYVWDIAKRVGVPESIVRKTPSADLWVGQTDEGELGLSYTDMDDILYLLVDKGWDSYDVRDCGFDLDTVIKINNRVRANRFKLRMPPVAGPWRI